MNHILDSRTGLSEEERTQIQAAAHAHLIACHTPLGAAQRRFADVVGDRTITVLDFGHGVPTRNQTNYVAALREQGFDTLADLLVEKGLSGAIPQDAGAFFSTYFGPDVRVVNVPCTHIATYDLSDTDILVLSGSPCMISLGLTHVNEPVCKCGETHQSIVEMAKKVLRHAITRHLPIVGVCFGHQLLTEHLGGAMSVLTEKRKHWELLQSSPYSQHLIDSITSGAMTVADGYIPVSHQELVTANDQRTAILHTTCCGQDICHTALHIPESTELLQGDAAHDARVIKSSIEAGESFGITFQSHPELAAMQPFTDFIRYGDQDVFAKAVSQDNLAAHMLDLITVLLGMRFAK